MIIPRLVSYNGDNLWLQGFRNRIAELIEPRIYFKDLAKILPIPNITILFLRCM